MSHEKTAACTCEHPAMSQTVPLDHLWQFFVAVDGPLDQVWLPQMICFAASGPVALLNPAQNKSLWKQVALLDYLQLTNH